MNKAMEALENLKTIDIFIDGQIWQYTDTDYEEDIKTIEQALSRPTAEDVLAVVEDYRNIEIEKFENHGASHNYHNVNLLNEIIAKIKEMLK